MDEYLEEFKKLSEQEHPDLMPSAIKKMDNDLAVLANQKYIRQISPQEARTNRRRALGCTLAGFSLEGAMIYSLFNGIEPNATNIAVFLTGVVAVSKLLKVGSREAVATVEAAETTDEFNQLVALRQEAYDRGVELGIFPKPEIVEGTDQQFAFHQDLVTQGDSMDLNLRTE